MGKNVIIDGRFQGNLKLSALLNLIDKEITPPFDIDITSIDLSTQTGTQSYALSGTANGMVHFGAVQLNFPQVSCDITVGNGKITTMDISLFLQVGDDGSEESDDQEETDDNSSLGNLFALSAQYSSDRWVFNGSSINPITTLSLTEFLSDILETFSLDLPSSFPDLFLTSLNMTLELESSTIKSIKGALSINNQAEINTEISKVEGEWNPDLSLDYTPNFDLIQCIPLVNEVINQPILIKEVKIEYTGQNGMAFTVTLEVGDQTVTLPPPKSNNEEPKALALVTPAPSSQPPALSYPVQKCIGPLQIEKIALSWQGGDLEVLLDVTAALEALTFDLMGFSIGFPLDNPAPENWSANLNGLGLTYSAGPIEMAGALLKQPSKDSGTTNYEGELIVEALGLNIAALGSLNVGKGPASLFAFAFLKENIGGPPYFFITGLSFGFGYNRQLIPPPREEVPSFPLVAGLSDPAALLGPHVDSPNSQDAVSYALEVLNKDIPEQVGEYWIAAGVQFTSFELLNTNALITAEFGKEFEIMVLGKSVGSFPAEASFSYVELGLEIIFDPGKGVISAEALLSPNSYILDRDCHLTGGFAFVVWFGSNPHAGDFVLTIGGYHPKFIPPDYYPREPRLGFNWIVDGNVTIKGGAYFALTPSCLMGGGSLEILFHAGNLKAWFTAYADFLIFWKPFYFMADMGVSIGVSYHIHFLFISVTFKVELGATVHLWGPPIGGKVHISWFIISFTISFGADQNLSNNKIDWAEFTGMLPQTEPSPTASDLVTLKATPSPLVDSCHITPTGGLIGKVEDKGYERWLIRADEFVCDIESQIPLTELEFLGETITPENHSPFSIRPMQIKEKVSSKVTITITNSEETANAWKGFSQKVRNIPEALWGDPVDAPSEVNPNSRLLSDRLVGLSHVTPASQPISGHTGPIDMRTAFTFFPIDEEDKEISPYLPFTSSAPVYPNAPEESTTTLNTIAKTLEETAEMRGNILNILMTEVGFKGTNSSLSGLAQNITSVFEAEPMLSSLPSKSSGG